MAEPTGHSFVPMHLLKQACTATVLTAQPPVRPPQRLVHSPRLWASLACTEKRNAEARTTAKIDMVFVIKRFLDLIKTIAKRQDFFLPPATHACNSAILVEFGRLPRAFRRYDASQQAFPLAPGKVA
ncbi:MAG TPA: hypothetical protein VJL90_09490 [Pseudorhodoplanes sp.]|nr:hypothetical protein [Pseudorhodoplanes sp.]